MRTPVVVHVISTPRGVGGAERLVIDLVEDAERRGRRDVVLNPFAAASPTALGAALPAATYRARVLSRAVELPATARWLRSELRAAAPDVVHVHLFHAAALVAALPRPKGAQRLLTHHHGDVLLVNGRAAAQRVDDAAVRRYDAVVAVSERVRSFLIGRGAPADRVRVIANGWSRPPSAGGVPTADGSEPHPHGPTALCVANLRPEKDHATLLAAFALVRESMPAARLRLVGGGPLRAEVESSVHALGLGGSVDVVGPSTDVWAELDAADVFVLTSRYEGMSIALLEAMSAGLPAVVTDVGGNAEVLGDAAGIVVAPGDVGAIAEALRALLGDRGRRERAAAAARAIAARYRLTTTLDAYDALYRELAEAGAR